MTQSVLNLLHVKPTCVLITGANRVSIAHPTLCAAIRQHIRIAGLGKACLPDGGTRVALQQPEPLQRL